MGKTTRIILITYLVLFVVGVIVYVLLNYSTTTKRDCEPQDAQKLGDYSEICT